MTLSPKQSSQFAPSTIPSKTVKSVCAFPRRILALCFVCTFNLATPHRAWHAFANPPMPMQPGRLNTPEERAQLFFGRTVNRARQWNDDSSKMTSRALSSGGTPMSVLGNGNGNGNGALKSNALRTTGANAHSDYSDTRYENTLTTQLLPNQQQAPESDWPGITHFVFHTTPPRTPSPPRCGSNHALASKKEDQSRRPLFRSPTRIRPAVDYLLS